MSFTVNFQLNQIEYISLTSDTPFNDLLICDEIFVQFHSKKNIRLYYNFAIEGIQDLADLLKKCLENKGHLHPSIKDDIGFLWDEKLNEKIIDYHTVDDSHIWVGQLNLLWSSSNVNSDHVSTWLYNNAEGEIILEITPDYPWTHVEPKQDEKFYSYEEFIKNYKPILFRTIPRDVAQRWLAQAQQLEEYLDHEKCYKQ